MSSASATKAQEGGAPGKRYYRIGEVSRITGVKPYVLRYWESEFRWMAPTKSRSKQRLYKERDIEIIRLIKQLLWDEKFTIAGARKKFQELGFGRAQEGAEIAGARQITGERVSGTGEQVPVTGEHEWETPRAQIAEMRKTLAELRRTLT